MLDIRTLLDGQVTVPCHFYYAVSGKPLGQAPVLFPCFPGLFGKFQYSFHDLSRKHGGNVLDHVSFCGLAGIANIDRDKTPLQCGTELESTFITEVGRGY